MATNVPVTLDTPIVIKVLYQGNYRKFKVPLQDLGAQVFPGKLRGLLQVRPDDEIIFERYSDSAGAYVTLDSDKPQVYKTLFRAAKAKLKLRLRATLVNGDQETPAQPAREESIPVPTSDTSLTSIPQGSTETLTAPVPEQVSPVIAHSPIPPPWLSKYMKTEPETEQVSPVFPLRTLPKPREWHHPSERPGQARSSDHHQACRLTLRPKEEAPQPVQTSWVVFCNNCNQAMENEHFHCSICDHGDYDLCQSCVDAGVHCPGLGHWMVKRFVQNGTVVSSVVERIAPKAKEMTEQEMPGAFTDEKQSVEPEEPTRTCNCCVHVLPEREFVTCTSCEDYDLCINCHTSNKHGHHPAHAFEAATSDTVLPALADFLCKSGRNVRHSAVCDGCEKFIYGVRHKCLNCPDWDFCSDCIKSAKFIHPRHRFVPIYEPLSEPATSVVRHYGIYCDGPLCKDRDSPSYIEGVRYKCAVCHDTDFCANCEAIPSNRHNRTHPLIKFKTPVRSVSVTTMGEDKHGLPMARLGDQPARRSTATETAPLSPPANAATQVQTIVDMKPAEESQPKATKGIEIRDLLAEPVQEKVMPAPIAAPEPVKSAPEPKKESKHDGLDAHFIRDTIPDGSKIGAGLNFVQVWTLRNPGPNAWPSGCSVRHVGGDNMLNIDNTRPLSHSELAEASESNVIGRPVEQGEEISFRIMMKAPNREGTAISYWRLKTADGVPFGHRLWCDIQVVGPTTPIAIPAAQPMSDAASSSTESSVRPTPNNEAALELLRRANLANIDQLRKIADETADTVTRMQKEKMLHIQKVRKAAVERLLENRRKECEARMESTTNWNNTKVGYASQPKQEETAELPVSEKAVEAKGESSGMIFPQLEKESPASSTHEGTLMQSESVKTETATVTAPSVQSDEFFEDAESVEIRSLSSDDEGFMTDEEYDILDASDEEIA